MIPLTLYPRPYRFQFCYKPGNLKMGDSINPSTLYSVYSLEYFMTFFVQMNMIFSI